MSESLATWQSWEIPVPLTHPFWSTGDLQTASITSRQLLNSGKLPSLRRAEAGWAPYLLSLLAVQPPSGAACELVARQLQSFLLWDDWLKRYGSSQEVAQLASVFAQAEEAIGTRAQVARVSEFLPSTATSFPPRLDAKFPLKRQAFVASLAGLSAGQATVDSPWLARYLQSLKHYATVGLPLHDALKQRLSAHPRTEVPINEYIRYRASTSFASHVVFLAAATRHLPFVSDSTFHVLLLPLVGLGSALVALHGDSILQQRHHHPSLSASLPVDRFFDGQTSRLLVDAVHVAFEQMAARLEQGHGDLPAEECEAVRRFVHLVRSTVHGVAQWHQSAWRFRDLTSTTASEADGSRAESRSAIDFSDSESESEDESEGDSMCAGAGVSRERLPQWLADEIDMAAAAWVA